MALPDGALSVQFSQRCVRFLKYSRPRSSSWQHFWQPYASVRLMASGSHWECENYSRTTTAPPTAYGCQTWSVALGAGLSLRVLENRVLRKMFCSERVKVTRDTRGVKICRTQGNKMKKNEMGGACGTYGVKQQCIQWTGTALGKFIAGVRRGLLWTRQ